MGGWVRQKRREELGLHLVALALTQSFNVRVNVTERGVILGRCDVIVLGLLNDIIDIKRVGTNTRCGKKLGSP